MTVYDPYTALLDAPSPVSSCPFPRPSPSSSRPSTSSSHAVTVAQQGEGDKHPEKPHQPGQPPPSPPPLPPPPYSATFHQHPSLRTTIFEPTSFEHGTLGSCLGEALTPSSPSSPAVQTANTDSTIPPSPTRHSVTFSASTPAPSDKTTASHHSRPPSRSGSNSTRH